MCIILIRPRQSTRQCANSKCLKGRSIKTCGMDIKGSDRGTGDIARQQCHYSGMVMVHGIDFIETALRFIICHYEGPGSENEVRASYDCSQWLEVEEGVISNPCVRATKPRGTASWQAWISAMLKSQARKSCGSGTSAARARPSAGQNVPSPFPAR